jgi:Uma2 family endonuclease
MRSARRHHWFSVEEYLDFELAHADRFEYADGAIVAMAGGSLQHNILSANTLAALHRAFAGPCRVMGSDQRIVTGDGLRTYPDAVVVCGALEVSLHKGTGTVHNPSILVEVLSPSTRDYDLGEKLERYQTVRSLQDVLLIDSERIDVRHVRRTLEGWETRRFTDSADAFSMSGQAFSVESLYAGVAFAGS